MNFRTDWKIYETISGDKVKLSNNKKSDLTAAA